MNSKFSTLSKFYDSLPPLPRGKHRVVAGIWEKNSLVSFGFSQQKTHPSQVLAQKNFTPEKEYLHAEIHALVLANRYYYWEPSKSSIYVLRKTRNGSTARACPCDGCREAIAAAGIRKVHYSDEHENFFSLSLPDDTCGNL